MAEKTGKKVGKYHPPEEYQFKKGYDPRRGHRPKGRRNFWTDFQEAWRIVAEQLRLNKEPDMGRVQILVQGIKHIFKGNPTILREFLDRIYGKPEEMHEIEADIRLQKMAELERLFRKIIEEKN